jgi:hypothetical protein
VREVNAGDDSRVIDNRTRRANRLSQSGIDISAEDEFFEWWHRKDGAKGEPVGLFSPRPAPHDRLMRCVDRTYAQSPGKRFGNGPPQNPNPEADQRKANAK